MEPLAETQDLSQFEGALFLRQLHAAGEFETDAACGLFFATDALVRDYTAKGDAAAIDALKELHLDVQTVWSHRFNEARPTAGPDGQMPGLHHQVMVDARERPNPDPLRLRPVHKMGAVHRLVEDSRAGWVVHWRNIADEHAAVQSSSDALMADSGAFVEGAPPDVETAASAAPSPAGS